ncbi:MAG: 16S rRNA (cytidine(1402)-2'-O)-methyltransferase [Bacteroidales bacterium]|nr:16S rRNA (cytidine(1402)-2'-O)-methyltransferase [Bacteroidales bacterium]MDD2687376.1 16S rRNA (cytidine(1402)-2'-O)-methyltransferase [Bacteroidales bacterium]MDD3330925.1 16S rRNA (cytidine(1402)-2'-O)-methyltransferase [Bacteroidales bacterium]MDD4582182.1 16S rRNA (cytidine(1402)-2'-O)-methyltransferase [Bacteroidales bacterium]
MAKLYIVPSPIGNLEDITLRALRILQEASIVLSEDTRVSKKLLSHYQIQKTCIPYHQFNEHKQLQHFIELIQQHPSVALLSDAGTPGISDPGYLLIRACIQENIDIECLPGATAFVPALVLSGFPCDRFYFYGFLPHKKGRQSILARLAQLKETFILYESPYRLLKTLEMLIEHCGKERKISISREISKLHEETLRAPLSEALTYFQQHTIKGEFVLIVEGNNME